jgi:hypothetical protein
VRCEGRRRPRTAVARDLEFEKIVNKSCKRARRLPQSSSVRRVAGGRDKRTVLFGLRERRARRSLPNRGVWRLGAHLDVKGPAPSQPGPGRIFQSRCPLDQRRVFLLSATCCSAPSRHDSLELPYHPRGACVQWRTQRPVPRAGRTRRCARLCCSESGSCSTSPAFSASSTAWPFPRCTRPDGPNASLERPSQCPLMPTFHTRLSSDTSFAQPLVLLSDSYSDRSDLEMDIDGDSIIWDFGITHNVAIHHSDPLARTHASSKALRAMRASRVGTPPHPLLLGTHF